MECLSQGTPLFYSRQLKIALSDTNSKMFKKYAKFYQLLDIPTVIQSRPQLKKKNLAINIFQYGIFISGLIFPKKYLSKVLVICGLLFINNAFAEKLMLNYFLEQIALHDNRMQPIEQQARNILQYKCRIQSLHDQSKASKSKDPYFELLLEQIHQKNIEYYKFFSNKSIL